MTPKFLEIKDIPVKVVDQTLHSDFPDISVRMPIYKLSSTHDKDYLEMRYRLQQGQNSAALNLSDHLLDTLVEARQAIRSLPVMTPDTQPFEWSLGPIEHLMVALRKLKEYHDSKKWMSYFTQFKQPASAALTEAISDDKVILHPDWMMLQLPAFTLVDKQLDLVPNLETMQEICKHLALMSCQDGKYFSIYTDEDLVNRAVEQLHNRFPNKKFFKFKLISDAMLIYICLYLRCKGVELAGTDVDYYFQGDKVRGRYGPLKDFIQPKSKPQHKPEPDGENNKHG